MIFLTNISVFFYVGLLLFTPHVLSLPMIYFIALVELLFFTLRPSISRSFFYFIFFILTAGFIASFINAYLSLEFVRQLLIFIIMCLGISRVFSKMGEKHLINIIWVWLIIESLIVITSGFFNDFALHFHDLFTLTEKGYRYIGDNVLVNRYSGLSPSGFSLLSIYLSLLLVMLLESNFLSQLKKVTVLFLVVISLLFIGRSGLFVMILYLFFKSSRYMLSSKGFSYIVLAWSIILLVISLESFVQTSFLVFALEPFFKGFDSVTLSTLINTELFFPDEGLLGSGALIRSEGGVDSDVGWVKLAAFWGYFFTLLYALSFVVLFFYKLQFNYMFQVLFFITIWFVFNFKDLLFVSSGYIQAFIILFLISRTRGQDVYPVMRNV